MPTWVRGAWGICQRTGRKVPLGQLVEDGEIPGLLVTKEDADRPHPQRYPVAPPPDSVIRRPAPPNAAIGKTLRIGTLANLETGLRIENPFLTFSTQSPTITTLDNAADGYGAAGYGTGGYGD